MSLDWDTCKAAFHVDGSLRDIYVHDTSIDDWRTFLDFLSVYDTSCFRDGEPCDLLPQISDMFDERDQAAHLLVIKLGPVQLNCHFFTVDEIELDVDPTQVTSGREFASIIDVIVGIGRVLKKNVVLTDEDAPDAIWFEYEAVTGTMAYNGASVTD